MANYNYYCSGICTNSQKMLHKIIHQLFIIRQLQLVKKIDNTIMRKLCKNNKFVIIVKSIYTNASLRCSEIHVNGNTTKSKRI